MKTKSNSKSNCKSNSHPKYNKSRVFKTAWQIWRKESINNTINEFTWSNCLKQSWNIEKNGMAIPTIEEIYKKYYQEIYIYIMSKIHKHEEAEEITQDVFMRCNKHLAAYDVNRAKITTWLHKIANNLIIDNWRKINENVINVSKFADAETGKEVFQFIGDDMTDSNVHNGELMTAIDLAMSKLKPKQKEIAIMYFKENEQYVKIAKVLEIPLNSVKATIFRIRESLQLSLKQEYAML
jgi:RNA polymerase sigma-70 factor (ECF subfamily)